MIELQDYAVESGWVEDGIQEELADYFAEKGLTADEQQPLVARLIDHFLFVPQQLQDKVRIQFRHPSYRDFMVAWRLREAFDSQETRPLTALLGDVEMPQSVLMFLGELLESTWVEPLRNFVQAVNPMTARVLYRNLVRLALVWRKGEAFSAIFPLSSCLEQKPLHGIVFSGIDLRAYSWESADLDGATFLNCDLENSDLGRASWRELRLDNCTLKGANFGEPQKPVRIFIDGQELAGEPLLDALRLRQARGLGIKEVTDVARPDDPVPAILREVLGKVVELRVDDSSNIAKVNKLTKMPSTFERGWMCAEYPLFVRRAVLPTLVREQYFEVTTDSYENLTAVRQRLPEIVDFLFRQKSSAGIQDMLASLVRGFAKKVGFELNLS